MKELRGKEPGPVPIGALVLSAKYNLIAIDISELSPIKLAASFLLKAVFIKIPVTGEKHEGITLKEIPQVLTEGAGVELPKELAWCYGVDIETQDGKPERISDCLCVFFDPSIPIDDCYEHALAPSFIIQQLKLIAIFIKEARLNNFNLGDSSDWLDKVMRIGGKLMRIK